MFNVQCSVFDVISEHTLWKNNLEAPGIEPMIIYTFFTGVLDHYLPKETSTTGKMK